MPVTSPGPEKEGECWPGVLLGQYWPRVASVVKQYTAWYVPMYFGSRAANLLVDSGAQVTMMSKAIYDSLAPNYRPKLTPVSIPINAANGGQIKTYGEAKFRVTLAKNSFDVDIIIANMGGIPGVLGMDFLGRNDAILNCKYGLLDIGGQIVICDAKRLNESGQVIVECITSLPPGHVFYVDVSLQRWGKSTRMYDILEPIAEVCNMEGILMPRSVISQDCNSCTLEIINIGGSVKTLPAGLVLAYLDPAEVNDKTPGAHAPTTMCSVTQGQSPELAEHLKPLIDDATDLDPKQRQELGKLLLEYEHCFEGGQYGLGQTSLVKHQIDTGDHNPIKLPPRRLGWAQKRALTEEVEKMLAKGVIEHSDSPWSSPPVLVKKKDGTFRFCVDYRKLNGVTRKDAYPLPRIDDCLDCLAGSQWFCTLDLSSGYWQIAMEDKDKIKTAFTSPRGHYQFKVMPFGVTNGPATLERLMELVLRGLSSEQCLCYMDDVIVCGTTFNETIMNLKEVLGKLSVAGLRLKPSKCELFRTEVSFLGHVVGRQGVKPDPKKIEAVQKWPVPMNVHELRSFVGFASYYRKYVPRFSEIASPLNALTQKDVSFNWTLECQDAFTRLKDSLTSAPVLSLPREGCPVILDTDASDLAIGGVLSQIIDGQEKVIAYASKSLSNSQRKYCTTYKELLAIVKMAKIFRPYIYGQPNVLVRTDHKALVWLQDFKDAEGMLARWLASLTEYDFKIEHREGRKHSNADGCSRIPVRPCKRTDCPDHCNAVNADIGHWNAKHGFDFVAAINRANTAPSVNNQVTYHLDQAEQQAVNCSEIAEIHVCAAHQQRNCNWMDALTDQQLQTAQSEDPDLTKVLAWLNKGERPTFEEISMQGSHLKNLWAQYNI